MRLETKFVQVPNNPKTINAINNLAAVWGWTVQSIQVTDSKVSYEGDSYGWVSSYGAHVTREIITEHTNYASITYQRDMDSPKYAELSRLEAEYNECDKKDFLTAEEESKMTSSLECAEGDRKKNKKIAIIAGVVSAYILLTVSVAIKNHLPIIAGIAIVVYFAKKSSNAYSNNHDLNYYNSLNEQRREDRKQELIERAKRV